MNGIVSQQSVETRLLYTYTSPRALGSLYQLGHQLRDYKIKNIVEYMLQLNLSSFTLTLWKIGTQLTL